MSAQALDNLNQASDTLEPSLNIDELIAQAENCIGQNQFQEAKALYAKVLDSQTHHAIANYGLGMIEANTTSVLEALPYFESAIKSDPNNEQYWVSYIDAFILSKQFEKAEHAVDLGRVYGLSEAYAEKLKTEITQNKQMLKHAGTDDHRPKQQPSHQLHVLIPAYKHKFLIPLLMGLRAQTFQEFKVIISDDSPNNEITGILREASFAETIDKLKIEVIQGPKQGPMTNIVHLIDHIQGAQGLVHFLLDDDVIYPTFYEEHIKAHATGNVGVSISYRWFVNEAGQPLAKTNIPAFINKNSNQVQRLESQELFDTVVPNCDNWLGEFSNVVFAADQLHKFKRSSLNTTPYYGLGDIGFYLEIAMSADLVLIKNYLSGFRSHSQQNSLNIMSKTFKAGLLSWIAIAVDAYQLNKISINQLNQTRHYTYITLARHYSDTDDMKVFVDLLEALITVSNFKVFESQFVKNWNLYLESCNDWVSAQQVEQTVTIHA